MTKDEALAFDLALEALELTWDSGMPHPNIMQVGKAITAMKQARSAPVQEPVAWLVEFENGEQELHFDKQSVGETQAPLYTTPPAAQRQWVSLTDAEVMQTMSGDWTSQFYFARAIEAKLKELNK
jgi:hypothetical protein